MSRPTDAVVSVRGTSLGSSAKAMKFRIMEVSGKVLLEPIEDWFPFSQMKKNTRDPMIQDGDTMVITEWIANKKGLLDMPVRTGGLADIPPVGSIAESRSHFDSYDDDCPF